MTEAPRDPKPPMSIPPRIGDHVEIKTPGRVVEMRLYAGVPGAVVQLDPTVSRFARDHPDGVPPARIWLPLDAIAVIPFGHAVSQVDPADTQAAD